MLYCANIDSLASRREDLSRDFFHNILDPASCLHSLLPPLDPRLLPQGLDLLKLFQKSIPVPTATVPSSNMLSTITSKSSCSIIIIIIIKIVLKVQHTYTYTMIQ